MEAKYYRFELNNRALDEAAGHRDDRERDGLNLASEKKFENGFTMFGPSRMEPSDSSQGHGQ